MDVKLNNNTLEQLGYEIKNNKIIDNNGKEVTDLVIPSTYTYNGSEYKITEIGEKVFSSCWSLRSVTIPDSVTKIGSEAFQFCSSLRTVIIPDSVTNIGDGAFWDCTSLTSLIIPNSVTKIGEKAFELCYSFKNRHWCFLGLYFFNISNNSRWSNRNRKNCFFGMYIFNIRRAS